MTNIDSAIWQKTNVPSEVAMQRTERTYERTNERHQDQGLELQFPYAAEAVDNRNRYVETDADHHFTAFLAALTPGKVLRDRSAMFSRVERKRERFLKDKTEVERFTARQLQIAQQSHDRRNHA